MHHCPLVRRARLILYKALALSSLVLAAMLLPSPARAGHWSLTATGSLTMNGQPVPSWGPPQGASTNSIGFSSYSVGAGGYGYPQYHTVGTGSVQISITATVTGSWVADGTSDETAPPSVVLQETSGAYYKASYGSGSGSGTASDGLSNPTDAVVSPYDTSYDASGSSSSVAAHYVKKSGSSWTESFTITASANASNPDGFAKAEVGFSGLTVSTHAQPYNMRLTPNPDGTPAVSIDNVNGRLLFHYSISSTDGNTADMTSITAYETLDWGSSNPGLYPSGYYAPPSPPIAPYSDGARYAYHTPQTIAFPALLKGYVLDEFDPPATGFVSPYPAPSTIWSVTQNYLFDDSATHETGIKIPGPDNNSPFTITRSVRPTNTSGTTGMYSISAHGSAALKSLP